MFLSPYYHVCIQVYDLEKDRVKLLERLRKQADLATGNGTFYGLTNEECDSVFELIEHIRYVGSQFNH